MINDIIYDNDMIYDKVSISIFGVVFHASKCNIVLILWKDIVSICLLLDLKVLVEL